MENEFERRHRPWLIVILIVMHSPPLPFSTIVINVFLAVLFGLNEAFYDIMRTILISFVIVFVPTTFANLLKFFCFIRVSAELLNKYLECV